MEFNYQALEAALSWDSLPTVDELQRNELAQKDDRIQRNEQNRSAIAPAIDDSTLPDLPAFQVHGFDVVSSTNTVAWDLLRQGAKAGTVVIARAQQSGRGQWGHQWSSLPGGLYLSIVLTPHLPIEHAGQLTLSSAWGIASALRHYGVPVQIKWLNDLVVNQRKLGGILTETRIHSGHIHQAVVGIGINWSNPVPEMGINLRSILISQSPDLESHDPESHDPQSHPEHPITSLETLAAVVLQGVRRGYTYWRRYGSEALVSAYETLLVNMGNVITLDKYSNSSDSGRTDSGRTDSSHTNFGNVYSGIRSGIRGTIVGITAKGQLRVQLQCPHQSSVAESPVAESSAAESPIAESPITEICLEPGTISLGYDLA